MDTVRQILDNSRRVKHTNPISYNIKDSLQPCTLSHRKYFKLLFKWDLLLFNKSKQQNSTENLNSPLFKDNKG